MLTGQAQPGLHLSPVMASVQDAPPEDPNALAPQAANRGGAQKKKHAWRTTPGAFFIGEELVPKLKTFRRAEGPVKANWVRGRAFSPEQTGEAPPG